MITQRESAGPSLRARALSLTLRCTVRPIISLWTLAPGLPWPYHLVDHAGRLAHRPRATRYATVNLGRVRAQWVEPASGGDERVILYLPGGAFLVGGWHLHRGLLGHLAANTGSRVLAVEYRKLPRQTLSDARTDAVDSYRYLLAQGIPAESIVVMGDSAGGFLALLLATEVHEYGLPQPQALVLLSPLLDLDSALPERGCAVLSPRAVRVLARVGRTKGPAVVSPLRTAAANLPPILIQSGRGETLHRQATVYADALSHLGVPHELQLWPVDIHVFHAARWLPETRQAWRAVVDFLDEVRASTTSDATEADAGAG